MILSANWSCFGEIPRNFCLVDKLPHIKKNKLLIHQNNVGKNTPYSPDLAPSDFYLFSDLKNVLGSSKRFGSNEEVIAETQAYFATKDKLEKV